jgi:hypothetical protein
MAPPCEPKLGRSLGIAPFLAETGESFFSVDRLNAPAFELVVTTIQLAAQPNQLVNVAGYSVLHQLARFAAGLRCQIIELLLELWSEMHFHAR